MQKISFARVPHRYFHRTAQQKSRLHPQYSARRIVLRDHSPGAWNVHESLQFAGGVGRHILLRLQISRHLRSLMSNARHESRRPNRTPSIFLLRFTPPPNGRRRKQAELGLDGEKIWGAIHFAHFYWLCSPLFARSNGEWSILLSIENVSC